MQPTPLDVARSVVSDEAAALQALRDGLGAEFESVVRLLLRPESVVVVSGLGKSGNIARKIAASLTSTGTPAVFMHPVEALHGDLGIVTPSHVLIALSRSGNTEELSRFAQHFRRLGGPVIGMTQNRASRLAEVSHHLLALPDLPESGPHGLAPTTSCVMMLAMGDALTMALLHARNFSSEDFARFHPEGSLGRRLLTRARDLMCAGERLPLVLADEPFGKLLLEMNRKGIGLALVVEAGGALVGTFTDGDLRRVIERVADMRSIDARGAWKASRRSPDAPQVPISTVLPSRAAVDCVEIMRAEQITSLVVAEADGKPVGVLRLMDALAAGLA